MAVPVDDYYDGFRTFSWLADSAGLPIDQVNFVITQFTALTFAGFLRTILNPSAVAPRIRHAYCLAMGFFLGYFCFGRHAFHLAGLPALCYIVMRTQDPRHIQKVVLVVALGYLSCIHFHRMIYDYGSYTLDITGPLMVITQKVTSLAYNIHDGLTKKAEELSPIQNHQAIRKIPSALEYFSYMLHFQALMAGPVIFYRDYVDFIHGQHIRTAKGIYYEQSSGREVVLEPSPRLTVIKKVIASVICAAIFVSFIGSYPIRKIKEDEFLEETSICYKIWYIMMATMVVRFKYYHAWIFADAICNNSGIGFNGYDQNGVARWDLISNVDVIKFEFSTNLKESIETWNTCTNRWLRSLVYDRATKHKILFTYALSAIWHGFYPGYYLTFANGAFFTMAARSTRRHLRPYFLGSKYTKFLYDVVTILATRVLMAYLTFSFVILEFVASIRMYLYLYLFPHVIGLIAIILLPHLPKRSVASEKNSVHAQEMSNGNAHKTT